MSAEASAWAWRQVEMGRSINHAGGLILLRLANRADEEGKCWPSAKRTAHDTRVSEREVRRTLSRFEEAGLIRSEARYSQRGSRISNMLHLQMVPTPTDMASHPPLTSRQGGDDPVTLPPLTSRQGELKRKEKKEKPPPSGEAAGNQIPASSQGGVDPGLIKIALQAGLSEGQAQRFARAARGANPGQLEALSHELPIRLPSARYAAALAIRLAQLASADQLEDTTSNQRREAAESEIRRAEAERKKVDGRRQEDEERARRGREGPSTAEVLFRQKINRMMVEMKVSK